MGCSFYAFNFHYLSLFSILFSFPSPSVSPCRSTCCSAPRFPPRITDLRPARRLFVSNAARWYLRILAPNTANSHESLRRIFPTGWRPTIITAYSPSLAPSCLPPACSGSRTPPPDEFDKRNGFFSAAHCVLPPDLDHYAP